MCGANKDSTHNSASKLAVDQGCIQKGTHDNLIAMRQYTCFDICSTDALLCICMALHLYAWQRLTIASIKRSRSAAVSLVTMMTFMLTCRGQVVVAP